jgi:hypothetical protein
MNLVNYFNLKLDIYKSLSIFVAQSPDFFFYRPHKMGLKGRSSIQKPNF